MGFDLGSVGGWLEKGKDLTEAFTKVKDAADDPKVKAGWNDQMINHHLRQVENRLEDEVKPDDINISATSKSELGEFIQKGLVAMGHNITADGFAGAGTVAALNTALMDKMESESGNKSVFGMGADKFEDLTEIDDITQLSGRHLQALVNELREREILTADTPEMLVELGQALRDIDNDEFQEIANDFAPKPEEIPATNLEVDHNSAPTAVH